MFEKCIKCERLGKDCFPNIYIMNLLDIREWARKLKAYKHISNNELSQRSGVPKGTIDMHFKKKTPYSADVNYSTFAPIICALVGCDGKEMECPPSKNQSEEDHDLLLNEIDYLKKQIHEEHRVSERRVKAMYTLGIILLVSLLLIIAALVTDIRDPSKGFFWLQ